MSRLSPLAILLATGLEPPMDMPQGVIGGEGKPIRFGHTFDDSDPDAEPLNFKAAAHQVDQAWLSRLMGAKANPEVCLFIESIEVEWLDDALAKLADPQKLATVWDGMYLEVGKGEISRKYPLALCNRTFSEVGAAIPASDAAATLTYQKPTRVCRPEPIGIVVDLENIDTCRITWDAAVVDILGADTAINAWVHGGAWRKNAPGADEAFKQIEKLTGKSCGESGNGADVLEHIARSRKGRNTRKTFRG